MRVCIACALAIVLAAPAAAAAAPRAWPGLAIGYRDLTGSHGYAAAIAEAAGAWNRLDLGVRFVPAPAGASAVQIVFVGGRCLAGSAGSAPTGFQRFGARVVVRSCPTVVRPLLVAHELGRVLGLENDDGACSLMNSRGRSDGLTFALPARCSRSVPPAWLDRLVDPRSAARARALYAAPPVPQDAALTAVPQPRIEWRQPAAPRGTRMVVVRTAGRCPTRSDLAEGTAHVVSAQPAYAGLHWAVDTTLPGSAAQYCYRVFDVSPSGRPTPSAPLTFVVGPGPAAAAAVTTAAVAGAPTGFADRSTDEGAAVVHWHWDFGDGTTLDTADPAAGSAPAHTYGAAGAYTVTLTVTDDLGRSATATLNVTVTAP